MGVTRTRYRSRRQDLVKCPSGVFAPECVLVLPCHGSGSSNAFFTEKTGRSAANLPLEPKLPRRTRHGSHEDFESSN